jgi:hypothetical protein
LHPFVRIRRRAKNYAKAPNSSPFPATHAGVPAPAAPAKNHRGGIIMSDNHSEALNSIRRLTNRFDAAGDGIQDFMQREMNGEKPDPAAFLHLLEQRASTKDALQAQFKLYEKPIKTVMNEVK